jgi:small-conductance mechanosensitive channel
LLWLVSFHFILKIIIKKYQKFTEFVLFKIQNTEITIGNLFFIVLAFAVTGFVVIMIRIAFNRLAKRKKIDTSTAVTLQNITKYFIWVFAIIIILESVGFNLSVLLAGSAALMVGLGMGIQQVFNDFASGLILLFERQIKVGDYVEADNVAGTVLDIGFRTTLLLTRDNVKIIIPNSKLVSGNVINWTKGEKYARVGIDVGVAYGSDTQLVKSVLIKCAKAHKDVLQNKEPEVFFLDFGDSALLFRLYFYVEKVFYREKIKSDLRFAIYDELNKAKIQIPFPQIDVHLPNKK